MQKKTIRTITLSKFNANKSPLFSQLHLIKLHDYIKFQTVYVYVTICAWQSAKYL